MGQGPGLVPDEGDGGGISADVVGGPPDDVQRGQFRQEYLYEFLDSDDALFNMDQVERMFRDESTDLDIDSQ